MEAVDSEFVGKLATAIVQVNEAQARLLEDVDTASSQPGVLQDPDWQAKSEAAAEQLSAAGAQLRIQPLPESMQAVDELLAQAQREGQVASQSHVTSVAAGDLPAMVGTLQHLDRMAQLIEQAYQLIRR